jgi:hypothetical protein
MVCFQAIVWSLANFRITRLVVLGVFGTVLTFAWILFSADILRFLMPGTQRSRFVNLHTIQMGVLCALSVASYGAACWAVGRQRHGASFKIAWPRIQLRSMKPLVAWASRPCVSIRTGETPVPLLPAFSMNHGTFAARSGEEANIAITAALGGINRMRCPLFAFCKIVLAR